MPSFVLRRRQSDLRLAVSEAVTNAVVHAFRSRPRAEGQITVSLTVRAPELKLVVRDNGDGMAPRDDSPGLGLGLPLISSLAHQMDHRRPAEGGTELWMCFRLM